MLISKPILPISVQTLSQLVGKITRSSLRSRYLVKVEHTMLIPRRIVIVKYSVVTEQVNEPSNIVETEHVDKLLSAKKTRIIATD